MSKPVRIREFVAAQIAALAEVERRSFANMVEVLLLAALTERGDAVAKVPEVVVGQDGKLQEDSPPGRAPRSVSAEPVLPQADNMLVRPRPHMKKHRPAVECPTRVPPGVTCPDCGQEV